MQRIQLNNKNCSASCGSSQSPSIGCRFSGVVNSLKQKRGRFVRLSWAFAKSNNSAPAKYISSTDKSITIYNSLTKSNHILPFSKLIDLRVG